MKEILSILFYSSYVHTTKTDFIESSLLYIYFSLQLQKKLQHKYASSAILVLLDI